MVVFDMIRGFCMALADSVPGVSGGTIAFLLGFYDKFIGSLDALISGTKQERKDALIFLIKLGIGWVTGFVLSVLVLTKLMDKHIYEISSIFLGLIICAIPYIIKEEKDSLKEALNKKYYYFIFIVIGILIVSAITYFNPASEGNGIDVSALTPGLAIYVFFVAMVAISAMVLPGISGSTLLLIFGVYMAAINAIKEILHFNMKYLPFCIVFGLGIITGILSVIKLIKMCLKKYRPQTIYTIIGLMIGSIYAIVMGPTTLEHAQPAMTFKTFNILFFIIGGVIIVGLEQLKTIMEKKAN